MKIKLQLTPLFLLLLSVCLLVPLQAAWADSATVTISTAASSNGAWSGASPDVWTPGDSISTVSVTEITDRLASTGVAISSETGSITVASAISWNSTNTLTLTGPAGITVNAAISGASGGLTLNANSTISTTAEVSVRIFDLQSGTWSQIASSLPAFSATDFRISGGTFIRSLAGDGSGSNPYQLADAYGLQGIGSSGMISKQYELANNIDASNTATWNADSSGGYYGFKPLGDITNNFTGNLNGQNHTISGLTINRKDITYVGLFSFTGSGTGISNLGLENVNVVGGSMYVGALAGYNGAGISNCYSNGTVTGYSSDSTASYVGGLLGWNQAGVISASHTSGTVICHSGYICKELGGLVGHNSDGTISDSHSNAIVTTNFISFSGGFGFEIYDFGGLVGYNSYSPISNCYATGAVTTNFMSQGTAALSLRRFGGLVGHNNYSPISNSYASNAVGITHLDYVSTSDTGGLVGSNHTSAISSSHFSGSVTGTGSLGGLVGLNLFSAITDSSVTGTVNSTGSTSGGLVSINRASPISNCYTSGTVSGGSGLIHSNENWFTSNSNIIDSHAIGNVSGGSGLVGTNFSNITNCYAIGDVSGGSGLVGTNSGSISNCYATGNVSGGSGLVGNNSGSISDSHATGSVSGDSRVGGLAGSSSGGSITNSYAWGNVTGSGSHIGGLVGDNSSPILNSYAIGNVTSTGEYMGGLVGYNTNATITNSYATGNVTSSIGGGSMGGLVGKSYGGSISNSYATGTLTGNTEVNGTSFMGGLVGLMSATVSISNSYATGAVHGYDSIGGLVGESHADNGSFINKSYATGAVTGWIGVGGLLGGMDYVLNISNSYATGAVTGNLYVGGLAGALSEDGSISNSYATGPVTGTYETGGFVGVNGGSISNSYATGLVTGTNSPGGFVGANGGSISSSYWDVTTSSRQASAGGVGLTTPQMKKLASFSGWDFSTIWRIYEDNSYPLLKLFMTPLVVTAINATKNFDNSPYSGGNGVVYSLVPNANLLGTLTYSGTSQGATAIGGSYSIIPGGLFSEQLGYDISFISGVLNINGYWLTLGISGSGTVNSSNGSGLGYACNTATCTAVPFGSNDTVTLTATGSNSTFSSWSGDYSGSTNPGSITMGANKAVTASFTPDPATVKIDGDSTVYYSINSALGAPTQDAVIQARDTSFIENVIMDNSHNLTLKGGYSDSNFNSQTGYSSISGMLTVKSGKLIVDRVVVGP